MIDAPKSKIQNSYLRKCFNKKNLIIKGIIAAIAFVIVMIPSLTMYLWCLNQKTAQPWGNTGFIYINIIDNPGIGFGGLSGNVAAIYAIQALILLALIAIFLLMCNDKITMSFVSLAIFGGAFNLFQRMTPWTFLGTTYYNCVLDYIKFGKWWDSFATFNFPDVFVVVGTIGFAISFIVITIIKAVKEDKTEKVENKVKPIAKSFPQSKPEVGNKQMEAQETTKEDTPSILDVYKDLDKENK